MTDDCSDLDQVIDRTIGGRFAKGHALVPRKSPAQRAAESRAVAVHVPYQPWSLKIKLLRIEDLDLRTKEGKRFKQSVDEREAELGGNLTEQQYQDLVALVAYEFIREHLIVMQLKGDPAFDIAIFHVVNKDIRHLRQSL